MDVLVANAGAGGAIVITGSITSIKGVPGFGVYAATKAALRSFARTWSVDLKGRNIRVNVISPGTVVTPAFKNELGLSDEQIEDFAAQAAAATPLGRTGTPDEIAKAIVFLASNDSSYVNAVELFVDGGQGTDLIGLGTGRCDRSVHPRLALRAAPGISSLHAIRKHLRPPARD